MRKLSVRSLLPGWVSLGMLVLSLWFAFQAGINFSHISGKLKQEIEQWFSEKDYVFPGTSPEFAPFYLPMDSSFSAREKLRLFFPENSAIFFEKNFGIFESSGHIFLFKKIKRNDSLIGVFQKIYADFPLENEYFEDHAHPFLTKKGKPVFSLSSGSHVLTFKEGKIFVRFRENISPQDSFLAWLLFVTAIFLVLPGFYFPFRDKKNFLFIKILCRILYGCVLLHIFPEVFYKHSLYETPLQVLFNIYTLYAGDLVVICLWLMAEGLCFHYRSRKHFLMDITANLLVLAFLFWIGFIFLTKSAYLLLPQRFSEFELQPAMLLFLIWSALSLWLFILLQNLKTNHWYNFLIIVGIVTVCSFVFLYSVPETSLSTSLICAVLFFIMISIAHFLSHSFFRFVFVFSGITAILTAGIACSGYRKSLDRIKGFAQLVMSDRDETLEAEFIDIPERIQTDNSFQNLLDIASDEELISLLKKNVFYGYFRRYQLVFNLFDENCLPLWRKDPVFLSNLDLLKVWANEKGTPTLSENLRFITLPEQRKSFYLGFIPVKNKTLVILMEPMPVGESGTVFDLFSHADSRQLLKKSGCEGYAVYSHSVLSEKFGMEDLPYVLTEKTLSALKEQYGYMENNGKIMFFIIPSGSTTEILQMFFSVFTIHGFLFFLLYFLYRFFEQNQEYQFMGFREKILLYFFSALLVLLGLVFTFLYSGITRQFKTHVYQLMHEHFQTLKKSIAPVIPDDLDFQYVKDPLDFAIKKFSFENNADVIFYDTLGTQRLTTLEKLNSWGIRGYMLSVSLLKELEEKKFAKIILEEKAGKLSYPCLYGPVYNSSGKKAGYVAMPFFPSRMEIYRQTDILLNSAVNMFIIFTLSALLLTYLLSGYLLRPLRLMASRLRSDKPVWETEPLEWKSEDEIRQLVDAYNAMLLQLKENIKKLSEQERESAWREMARQIAHEIKNPLTPIKLSIQHLMYLYRQNPEQFEKKFPESSKAIIQQIDALAAIASEFSHFARISQEPFAPTDLKECIESVIRLYENSFLQIKTHFPDTPLIINGNKNQIIAVFNNLMENARQAMENQNNPEVTIDVSVTSDSLEVLFMDNGPGIPEEIREKLFLPYFTTKSSGSGLGLAIVQRIVQHHNGSIELIPSEKGACFRIKIPFNKNFR